MREPAAPLTTRIGWVLLSPRAAAQPSTRIAALNMMGDLQAHGFVSSVLYEPEQGCEQPELPPLATLLAQVRQERLDLVVLQKVHGPAVLALADALRREGVKTVYMVCDLVLPEMVERTDLTLTVTDYLRQLHPAALQPKIRIVHDGIEHAELHKTAPRADRGSAGAPLRATLVTSAPVYKLAPLGAPPDWLQLKIVGRYPPPRSWTAGIAEHGWRLKRLASWAARWRYLGFVTNPRIRTENWSVQRAHEALLGADIGIIPVDTRETAGPGAPPPMWMRKSENRLTMKMSMGLPVIASPVPAYLDVIEQGVNGFIARDAADWRQCLEALRDPQLRRDMGAKARETVLHRFSRERQAEALAAALRELAPAPEPGPAPEPTQPATQST